MNIIEVVFGVIALIIIVILAIAAIFKNAPIKDNDYYGYIKNTVTAIVQNEQCRQVISSIIKDAASEKGLSKNDFINLIEGRILEAIASNDAFKKSGSDAISSIAHDDSNIIVYQILAEYGIVKPDYTINDKQIDELREEYSLSNGIDTTEVPVDENEEVEMVDPGYDPEDCLVPESDDFEGEDDVETVETGYDPEDGVYPEEDDYDIAHFEVSQNEKGIVSVIVPKDFRGDISIKDNEGQFIGGVGTISADAIGEGIGEGTLITHIPESPEFLDDGGVIGIDDTEEDAEEAKEVFVEEDDAQNDGSPA